MSHAPRLLPRVALVGALAAATLVPLTAPAAAADPPPALQTAQRTRPVAPGITLTSTDTVDGTAWLRTDTLSVDLGKGATVDYLSPGTVAADDTVRAMAAAATSHGTRPVAAVNGDFFDINNSGAALGVGVESGTLVQSPTEGWHNAVGFSAEGLGRLLQVYFEGSAGWPGGSVPLTQLNNRVAPGGVGLFTARWGAYPRQRAVDGATDVAEVLLTDGVVSAVSPSAGTGTLPQGSTVLLGREGGAAALRQLAVGDRVTVSYRPRSSDGGPLHAAVGGNFLLVKDGVPQTFDDNAAAARTAIGFDRAGTRMFLLTVDGKQVNSAGVGLTQWARMVADAGAYTALNIDGGGSSTLLARRPGEEGLTLENSPSDGAERAVANGLALYAPKGSGTLRGYWVAPDADPAAAPGADQVTLARPDRVFPGLTRRLTAHGYDETYGPAPGAPLWLSDRPLVGWPGADGVFHALFPGTARVTARRGAAVGATEVTVLQPLDRVTPTVARLGLSGTATTGGFGIVGADRQGFTAPIEPADVKLDYDRSLFAVAPGPSGTFTVSPQVATGAGLITATVSGHRTTVAVTVGLTDVPVASFDDAAQWTFSQARASGSLSAVPGRTGTGLKLSYDFTQSTATRAAYANPPAQFTVDGQPQAFGMWIHGGGKGEWPALEFYDGLGQAKVLRGDFVTWTGWRYVEMPVPAGIAYPLRLRRFYVVETKAAAQYTGEVIVDDLVAKVPPSVVAPPEPRVQDPVIAGYGAVAAADWRFAVMSDSQFVARAPDSDIVANARRTLREIRAARPDLLIIDGDFVDEASAADIAFAKQVLDEEIGDSVPYYYVPGNHEIMGGPIANFQAVFGATRRVFDHRGTRFVTLDTSPLTIRGAGFDQYGMLKSALDSAAADPAVDSVVVVQHVPPRDPTPALASQLNDRKEAELLQRWLAGFRAESGKGAAFIGAHVGTFHASRVDGVPYFVNGNSGKNPSTAADDGGFTGWSLWGVTGQQLSVQVNPHVDALAITAPTSLARGATAEVAATLTQPGGRAVPVAYPVSLRWSGGPGLHIGPRLLARPWDVASFDPATGELTALRPGTAALSVTVNGVTAAADVTVTG
ncbi:phosphodiester glycosidase family protein [Catellatospora sp. KI3]|uniref:phosphodiester glycosidase family protein n=1 Tax=Catellatospora sp. KI3 TaxID=3041620 RepID=UPI00248325F8|nr:phosphodiester glycosidase family protein [Catellatospora sp. KI3]MDI1463892.1 phosphodiester glycosidase family protein [Catellatospora sp. KI3]